MQIIELDRWQAALEYSDVTYVLKLYRRSKLNSIRNYLNIFIIER